MCYYGTNMHFIKDIETGRIGRVTGPIVIGQRCWLNPGTVVSKNAVVPVTPLPEEIAWLIRIIRNNILPMHL